MHNPGSSLEEDTAHFPDTGSIWAPNQSQPQGKRSPGRLGTWQLKGNGPLPQEGCLALPEQVSCVPVWGPEAYTLTGLLLLPAQCGCANSILSKLARGRAKKKNERMCLNDGLFG